MLRSPLVAIFREGFIYKEYITKANKPMYKYQILRYKYMIHNIC